MNTVHKPTRVLIVDDSDETCRELTATIATFPGFEVVGRAANGSQAVQLYQQLQPDIVCMDIVMPGMDGVQATRFIKHWDPHANIVVVSSEWPTDASVLEALRLGARKIVTKPIDKQEFFNVLQALREREKTVLVVEDTYAGAKSLEATFNSIDGFRVIGYAVNGAKAIRSFQQVSPDVVCMDMVMPELDGIQATRVIMQVDPSAKVIIVSSQAPNASLATEARRAGAKGVLAKPVNVAELEALLRAVCA